MTPHRRLQHAVAERLRRHLFAPPASAGSARFGAEIEFLTLHPDRHTVSSVAHELLPFLERYGRQHAWCPAPSEKGGPRYRLESGGQISIEPGGQLEYASPPFTSPAALLDDANTVLGPLSGAALDAGIEFVARGIDPFNALADVPLQIAAERYRCMDWYFSAVGGAGTRMMRQTAALQVNVDPPHAPASARTWCVLNAASPALVALFANSRFYAGKDTGCASYRAETWRATDDGRTGVFLCRQDAAEEYAAFALAARNMFRRSADGLYLSMMDWLLEGGAGMEVLDTHLSTLFPEVRPKRHYEVRSMDALPLEWIAAPVLVVAGLAADDTALHEAAELLGAPDAAWLDTAGALGMHDPARAGTAADLFEIALRACARRGSAWCGSGYLETASAWFDRFTRRGQALADTAAA
jgi:glutamate--cysteine ligase